MFEMSSAIDKLAPALVAVQKATFGVERNAVNGGFKGSRYADLAATSAACREALTSNGFTVSQWPGEYDGTAMAMTTILLHTSGQWMRGTMTVPLGRHDAQGYGSAMTYARRYSLQAVVGLSPEDDDGNAAVRPVAPVKPIAEQAEAKRGLDGPYTSKAALFAAFNRVQREVMGCGDDDMLSAYLATEEARTVIAQCERDARHYLHGGEPAPEDFEPLYTRIKRMRDEFQLENA